MERAATTLLSATGYAVSTGDTVGAMQTALGQPRVADRVVALTIIAESLANLPGRPNESLDYLIIRQD